MLIYSPNADLRSIAPVSQSRPLGQNGVIFAEKPLSTAAKNHYRSMAAAAISVLVNPADISDRHITNLKSMPKEPDVPGLKGKILNILI